jgi:hypothetical protein
MDPELSFRGNMQQVITDNSLTIPLYQLSWSGTNLDFWQCTISKMNFSNWEPRGVCERGQSVNFEVLISGEN